MSRSIAGEAAIEQVILKSRFIAAATPVDCSEAAMERIGRARGAHPQASHHCYAYAVGPNRSIQRYSDQGEPSGTAGMPILEAILKRDLTDVLVVVTRYFGGVLLGAGGLARAYGGAAGAALDKAGVIVRVPSVACRLCVDYAAAPVIERMLEGDGRIRQLGRAYLQDVCFTVVMRREDEEAFLRRLADLTRGQYEPTDRQERLEAWPTD